MAKKSDNAAELRLAILAAAADLFSQKGIEATSLFDIAAAVDISKGTLYYHYASKQQLLEDIARMYLDEFTALLYAWIDTLDRDGDPVQSITSLLEVILRDPPLIKLGLVLKTEAALKNPTLVDLFNAAYTKWSLMLEVGALKMPPAAAHRLNTLGRSAFALLDGYAMHELLGMKQESRAHFVNLLLSR